MFTSRESRRKEVAESPSKKMRCTGPQLLAWVSTAGLTFWSRTYLERLGKCPDGPRKEVMQLSKNIPPAPSTPIFKEIITADLLTVKSVVNNFGKTSQTLQGFVIAVYKAQLS